MLSAVDLTPAVHATGPSGARTIGGAMSFESLYLLNGVEVQDNIRGTPFSLFIEDAIQETTTTTSGISAEYGRFLGGVINTVTKSGGNLMSGSFRTTFTALADSRHWQARPTRRSQPEFTLAIVAATKFRWPRLRPTLSRGPGGTAPAD
jgi:hypothetical protein